MASAAKQGCHECQLDLTDNGCRRRRPGCDRAVGTVRSCRATYMCHEIPALGWNRRWVFAPERLTPMAIPTAFCRCCRTIFTVVELRHGKCVQNPPVTGCPVWRARGHWYQRLNAMLRSIGCGWSSSSRRSMICASTGHPRSTSTCRHRSTGRPGMDRRRMWRCAMRSLRHPDLFRRLSK